jgi:Lrp/AsnC family transcriptional regulator, leucine-responsive regulatory protein
MGDHLDSFDRKLLDRVQRNADLSAEAIGQEIGLSGSAVLRRLKRLKAVGIIQANVALVDPAKVGRPTFFIVALEVERERPELMSRLRQWLGNEDQVQQAFYVTGSADFILVITARDVESYDALMTRLMADNPNVRRFTTNVALAVSKRGVFVRLTRSRPAGLPHARSGGHILWHRWDRLESRRRGSPCEGWQG